MEIMVTLIDWITGEPNDTRSFENFDEFLSFANDYFDNIANIVVITK